MQDLSGYLEDTLSPCVSSKVRVSTEDFDYDDDDFLDLADDYERETNNLLQQLTKYSHSVQTLNHNANGDQGDYGDDFDDIKDDVPAEVNGTDNEGGYGEDFDEVVDVAENQVAAEISVNSTDIFDEMLERMISGESAKQGSDNDQHQAVRAEGNNPVGDPYDIYGEDFEEVSPVKLTLIDHALLSKPSSNDNEISAPGRNLVEDKPDPELAPPRDDSDLQRVEPLGISILPEPVVTIAATLELSVNKSLLNTDVVQDVTEQSDGNSETSLSIGGNVKLGSDRNKKLSADILREKVQSSRAEIIPITNHDSSFITELPIQPKCAVPVSGTNITKVIPEKVKLSAARVPAEIVAQRPRSASNITSSRTQPVSKVVQGVRQSISQSRPHSAGRVRSSNVGERVYSPVLHTADKFWPFLHTNTTTAHTNPADTKLISSKIVSVLCKLLDMLRGKATLALDIIESADRLWRGRVEEAHNKVMVALRVRHDNEIEEFRRNRLKTLDRKDIAVHAVRVHGAHVGGHHVVHISDMHTDTSLSRINNMKNKLLERHEIEVSRTAAEINTPLKQLDNLKAKISNHIEFCVVRAERAVEHFVRSDLAASQNKACEILQLRSSLAKESAYSIIRQSLTSLVNICSKIPNYYSITDDSPPIDGYKPTMNPLEKFILKISQTSFLEELKIHDDAGAEAPKKLSAVSKTPVVKTKRKKKTKKAVKYSMEVNEHTDMTGKFQSYDELQFEPLKRGEKEVSCGDMSPEVQPETWAYDTNIDDDDEENSSAEIDQADEVILQEYQKAVRENSTLTPTFVSDKHSKREKSKSSRITKVKVKDVQPLRANVVSAAGMFQDLGVDTSAYMCGILARGKTPPKLRNSCLSCSFCQQSFSGPGKTVPSLNEQANEYLSRRKLEEKKSILTRLRSDTLTVSERNAVEAKAMLLVRQQDSPAKQFCSWECVKSWSNQYTPIQQRYNVSLLIDLVAGYIV